MSTAEVLSVIAVVISALSVLAGLLRFRHERTLEDRADARSTLAAAALALNQTKVAQGEVYKELGDALAGKEDWPPDFDTEIAKIKAATDELDAAFAAVRIRFKPKDDVVTELYGALWSVRELMTIYHMATVHPQYETQDPQGPDSDAKRYGREALKYAKHQDAYLAAAQKAVGVRL